MEEGGSISLQGVNSHIFSCFFFPPAPSTCLYLHSEDSGSLSPGSKPPASRMGGLAHLISSALRTIIKKEKTFANLVDKKKEPWF